MVPVARTYLFVPGDRPERFDRALASGADAVILDLEDSVAPAAKSRARTAIAQRLLAATQEEHRRLIVRINDESTPDFDADLTLLDAINIACVMLPKAERPATVARLRKVCLGIEVLALIETARGVLQAEALAETSGVVRLVFGTIDYALDLNLSGDSPGFDYAACRLTIASRAAGLPAPVAGVTPEIADPGPLLSDLQRARANGFSAKLCIHPKQIDTVHAALQPSTAELDWARRVIGAAQMGIGAVQVDGRMVDKPVLHWAKALIARAER